MVPQNRRENVGRSIFAGENWSWGHFRRWLINKLFARYFFTFYFRGCNPPQSSPIFPNPTRMVFSSFFFSEIIQILSFHFRHGALPRKKIIGRILKPIYHPEVQIVCKLRAHLWLTTTKYSFFWKKRTEERVETTKKVLMIADRENNRSPLQSDVSPWLGNCDLNFSLEYA